MRTGAAHLIMSGTDTAASVLSRISADPTFRSFGARSWLPPLNTQAMANN